MFPLHHDWLPHLDTVRADLKYSNICFGRFTQINLIRLIKHPLAILDAASGDEHKHQIS